MLPENRAARGTPLHKADFASKYWTHLRPHAASFLIIKYHLSCLLPGHAAVWGCLGDKGGIKSRICLTACLHLAECLGGSAGPQQSLYQWTVQAQCTAVQVFMEFVPPTRPPTYLFSLLYNSNPLLKDWPPSCLCPPLCAGLRGVPGAVRPGADAQPRPGLQPPHQV